MKSAPTTKTVPTHRSGTLSEIPRLNLIRKDLLNSKYHLCTQKASLMTEYFRQRTPKKPLTDLFFKAYYWFYSRSPQGIE